MDELSSERLWKTLDSISVRLESIEKQLSEIVRLEERVNNHERVISRYGNKLEKHEGRLHNVELWQAGKGDNSSLESVISNVRSDLITAKNKIEILESNHNVNSGTKKAVKEVIKWVFGVLAAVLAFHLTKGL